MQQIKGLGGTDPAPAKIWSGAGDLPPDEVHAYADGDSWLYVTWGLSALWSDAELPDDEADEAEPEEPSCELTIRVRRDRGNDKAPPEWPVSLLENLCGYVATTGHAFDAGHLMHLRGPLALDEPTELCAVAFAVDPRLGERVVTGDELDAPVRFLQLIALTDDEYRAARRWSVEGLLALFADPLGVVDLSRTSRLGDPRTQKAVAAGTRKDGSATSELFIPEADWRRGGDGVLRMKIGAASAVTLGDLLNSRLPFGRPLLVVSARAR